MIRGIIFDCFGVLYQGSIAHLYELVPEASRAELMNLSLSSDYGYVTRDDFVAQVCSLTGKTAREIEMIMQSDHIRNTALVTYVRTLRPQYKLALLSNVGRGVIDQLFNDEELHELFDTVVLSSEVGMIKPDPDIYRLTLQRMTGVAPDECIMIDDIPANTDGAEAVGMHGVVFNTTAQCVADIERLISQTQVNQ
jgi:HAD superfamily hydrolase (TIGR01509 family)